MDKPSRRERHPEHSDEQDCSRRELEADRYEPRGVGLSLYGSAANVVGSIVDPERDHNSKGNGKLLASYESTTNLTVNALVKSF
jgi:hypothetical protein